MKCASCGNEVPEGSRFCNNCGLSPNATAATAPPAQTAEPAPKPQKPPSPLIAVLLLFCFWPVGLWLTWKQPGWSKTAKTIITVVCLILVVAGFSAVGGNKSSQSVSETTSQDAAPAPKAANDETTQNSPKVTVTATKLHSDYAANQVAADAKYKDQLICVKGTVNSIGSYPVSNAPYVDLDCGDYVVLVQCEFSDDDKAACARLTKGQQVSIIGTCSGSMGNITIDGCKLSH
ncbi:MAG: hypothetical protein P4L33_21875 [Capsulimonadaceae bacterium]|nr:hypothetical protein [Capsulimonadaceae bacterium]